MKNSLTIIMYHYVRDIRKSSFPGIKGLEVSDFREQLTYIKKHYQPVSMQNCISSLENTVDLPPNAALLTFDDGLADHFISVFPELDKQKIPGAFFPPGKAISERKILDVHKIHHILSVNTDSSQIVKDIFSTLIETTSYSAHSLRKLYDELSSDSRFDSPDVTFIKRALQKALPRKVRSSMVNQLFKKYVSKDEIAFANDLYLSEDQIRSMLRNGMEFGSHGWEHLWLNTLPPEEQETEIEKSVEFLSRLGVSRDKWAMCYPYGAYNDATLEILARKGCGIGFTTQVDIATINSSNNLTLPRLDTNDLPKKAEADANSWTLKILRN
jgi:peptidoglycan/xylan/chitin deacetylase (PgdA/CDA1 family)